MGAALGWGLARRLLVDHRCGARPGADVAEQADRIVLAFGAGALISAVSFDLAEEGASVGSGAVGGARARGGCTHLLLRRPPRRTTEPQDATADGSGGGTALALGAFLDGIPEQMVLGIGLASGEGVSLGLLAAIFISNLPEAVGSATEMRSSGRGSRFIATLWVAVSGVCTHRYGRRIRSGVQREWGAAGIHRRLRRRCIARHADRLDDPGCDAKGRSGRRACNGLRLCSGGLR